MNAFAFALACVLAAVACPPARAQAESSPPQATSAQADPPVAPDSRRDILVMVDNPAAPPPPRAGSSLLGYAPSRLYGVGQQAAATLAAVARQYGLRELAAWPIRSLHGYCAILQPPPGASREQLLAALAADARVALAQPLQDFSVRAALQAPARPAAARYNDPYLDLQRGFLAVDAGAAQRRSLGQGVEVAIVDTGADTGHPDLRGRIRTAQDLAGGDASAFARDAHGTEIAGIIAANSNNRIGIVGIAPRTMLGVYKACWSLDGPGTGARCNSFTLAKALAAIADSRARIVNLSLGGPTDPLLRRLLDQLLEQGRIVIAAMPPDGRLDGFPTEASGVIVVRASRGNTAPAGVLDAPGDDILTTRPGGRYDFASGSSMAAAHVSGMAALLLSVAPDLDAARIRTLLQRTSRPSQDDGDIREVNAEAAMQALSPARKAATAETRP